jgi:hypothetical protein
LASRPASRHSSRLRSSAGRGSSSRQRDHAVEQSHASGRGRSKLGPSGCHQRCYGAVARRSVGP